MHNSDAFWASVDRPLFDERHYLLIDVINNWDKDISGTLFEYLSWHKEYPDWLCRGLIEAYTAYRSEARRLNATEQVKGAKGEVFEREVMHRWYEKHYPNGLGDGCGFAEFSRLLDEHPE